MIKPKKISKKVALTKTQNICARQEKCVEDIRTKLSRWGLNDSEKAEIITALVSNSYIDNLRYARAFVREKSTIGKWGIIKIRYALKQKKIAPEDIQLALKEINEITYDEIIKKELLAKLKSIKDQDIYKTKSKLIRFGISRGYENGKIFDMVNKILKDSNSD